MTKSHLFTKVAFALLISPALCINDRWNTKPIPDDVDSETGITTSGSSSSTPPPPLPCSIQRGFFGEESDEVIVVDFFYNVEINKTSNLSIGDIVGKLELSIADSILPALFPDACPSPTKSVAMTRSGGRRLQEIKGLSSLPPDSVIPGVDCEVELIDIENPCYVVDSSFSIYSVAQSSSIYTTAMSALQSAVSDGLLINNDVVQFTIIDIDPDTAVTDVASNNREQPNDNGNSIAATVYISISAGVVIVVAVALMYRRRRNQSNVDADSTIMTPSLPPNAQQTETPVYDLNKVT